MSEKTMFKIKLIKSTAYNSADDILKVKALDKDGNVYYYDSMNRWCYLKCEEEGVIWERIKNERKRIC
jgi:hypothetical protein